MNIQQASVMNGLNTDTFKVLVAGVYSINVNTNVNIPSGLTITISQTGSASNSYSSPVASAQTNHIEMNAKFNCAIGDILSVVVSSSAPADEPPSLLKSTIILKAGI